MKVLDSRLTAALLLSLATPSLAGTTHFVDLNSRNPTPPFTDWATAATNIQEAVDAAADGDLVLVTNGVYGSGFGLNYYFTSPVTNRVAVTKGISVHSVNGPGVTFIEGYQVPGTTNAASAIRCVYLASNAVLSGFTLTNGATQPYAGGLPPQAGGGVYCESSGAVVSNCVIVGNAASYEGGGGVNGTFYNCVIAGNSARYGGGTGEAVLFACAVSNNVASVAGGGCSYGFVTNCTISANTAGDGGGAWGTFLVKCVLSDNHAITNGGGAYVGSAFASSGSVLLNCVVKTNSAGRYGGGIDGGVALNSILTGNTATLNGGGAYSGQLWNCLITSNSASFGGGAANASGLANCTVAGNSAPNYGGTYQCTLMNCIVYYNSSPYFPVDDGGSSIYSSCLPVSGTITNPPLFADMAGGDFRLQSNSPCINAGNNAFNTNNLDVLGNPRIAGGTIDLGAYEFPLPTSVLSYSWAQQYGLPTDGSADFADPDGDGLNNFQEWLAGTIPTNAASVLRMFAPSNRPVGLRVSWQSVSGKHYFLRRATNLNDHPAFMNIGTNLPGQAGITGFSDTTATNGGPYFYRVGVQ